MTAESISRFFMDEDKYILTTHESPDGDGLGAEYALCRLLSESGKTVRIINSDELSWKYSFFDERKLIRTLGTDTELPPDLSEWILVVVDTEPTNIGSMAPHVLSACRRIVVIDHHSPKKGRKIEGWLRPEASSTCEMVYEIMNAVGFTLQRDVAEALYTGIVYDTGSFIYPKTTPSTFRIAEALVSAGVAPNEVYTHLYESKSIGALMLQSLVTSTMVLHENDRAAVQVMSLDTLIASGADYDEAQEIVNIPLQSAKVRVSVFIKEDTKGTRRCSIRSKGEVDCAAVAQSFGGGGHPGAAGFRFTESFAEIQDRILESIRPYLP